MRPHRALKAYSRLQTLLGAVLRPPGTTSSEPRTTHRDLAGVERSFLTMQTRRRGKRKQSKTPEIQERECPVCLEVCTEDQVALPFGCTHSLCTACNETLEKRNDLRCPVCRTPRIGVTSATAQSAAERNAAVPDHAIFEEPAFLLFPNQSHVSLTNAFLFGGSAEIVPTSFPPPRTSIPGWILARRLRRPPARANRAPIQSSQPTISRALLLAQSAASALCDPDVDEETFANTIANALMEESYVP